MTLCADIGGTVFKTAVETLRKFEGSMLAEMFSGTGGCALGGIQELFCLRVMSPPFYCTWLCLAALGCA